MGTGSFFPCSRSAPPLAPSFSPPPGAFSFSTDSRILQRDTFFYEVNRAARILPVRHSPSLRRPSFSTQTTHPRFFSHLRWRTRFSLKKTAGFSLEFSLPSPGRPLRERSGGCPPDTLKVRFLCLKEGPAYRVALFNGEGTPLFERSGGLSRVHEPCGLEFGFCPEEPSGEATPGSAPSSWPFEDVPFRTAMDFPFVPFFPRGPALFWRPHHNKLDFSTVYLSISPPNLHRVASHVRIHDSNRESPFPLTTRHPVCLHHPEGPLVLFDARPVLAPPPKTRSI